MSDQTPAQSESAFVDESLAPVGIETHVDHRVSLTGGEDAPLGLFCESCGEYLIEWGDDGV